MCHTATSRTLPPVLFYRNVSQEVDEKSNDRCMTFKMESVEEERGVPKTIFIVIRTQVKRTVRHWNHHFVQLQSSHLPSKSAHLKPILVAQYSLL
jgi:hypothetical protein